jgi:hypothetical protein
VAVELVLAGELVVLGVEATAEAANSAAARLRASGVSFMRAFQ